MPISINDLQESRKTLAIHFGADTLNVTYRPNALTPAREMAILRSARAEADELDEADELEQAEYNITRQLVAFSELVEAWDFEGPLATTADGDRFDIPKSVTPEALQDYCESRGATLLVPYGEVVPVRPEFLRLIGSTFLMTVTMHINEDMRPDPKRRKR